MKRNDFLAKLIELSALNEEFLSLKDMPLIQCKQPSFVKRIKAIQLAQCQISLPQSTQYNDDKINKRVLILKKQSERPKSDKIDEERVRIIKIEENTKQYVLNLAKQRQSQLISYELKESKSNLTNKQANLSLKKPTQASVSVLQVAPGSAKSFCRQPISISKRKLKINEYKNYYKSTSMKRHSTSIAPSFQQVEENLICNNNEPSPSTPNNMLAQSILVETNIKESILYSSLEQSDHAQISNSYNTPIKVSKCGRVASYRSNLINIQQRQEEEKRAKLNFRRQVNKNYGKPFNPPPKLTAKSYIVYQSTPVVNKSRLIVSFNSKNTQQVASLTKIMTCILSIQLASKYNINISTEEVVIGKYQTSIGGTSAQIQQGEIYTVEDLLYGLMLPSGNDASLALAVWCGRLILKNEGYENNAAQYNNVQFTKGQSYSRFIAEMNRKAAELHMGKTHYANSHGLNNSNNKSSAFDIAILCEYAMKNAVFRTVVQCKQYKTTIKCKTHQNEEKDEQLTTSSTLSPKKHSTTSKNREIIWQNTHKLMRNKPQYTGIKTGMTSNAGACLSSCISLNDRSFIIIVLGCNRTALRFKETQILRKWLYKHEGIQHKKKKGESIASQDGDKYQSQADLQQDD